MSTLVDGKRFACELAIRFPLIDSLIDDDDRGMITFEMMALCEHTQAAIDRGDLVAVERCFRFADWSYTNADAHVRNAVLVSFLEHLDFEGPIRGTSEAMLTKSLRDGRKEIFDSLKELSRDKKHDGSPRNERRLWYTPLRVAHHSGLFLPLCKRIQELS